MVEIKWEPFLNDSDIDVAVKNGVITISGLVARYAKN